MGRSLRHPNIVPIFEVHAKGRLHFLVMDFVEGRNLREFVKIRKRLTPLEATRVITDIASGLAYAAERGINTSRPKTLERTYVKHRQSPTCRLWTSGRR